MSVKYGLPPIAAPDAGLFILGSLPGDASLAAARYYAHPANQFWRLLGGALGEDLATLDYDARLARLAAREIGLWDVIASAERPGSLDQALRGAAPNAIDELLREFPGIRAIAFNGATAARIGRRLVPSSGKIDLIDLPSSSAANTRAYADKAKAWAALRPFTRPATTDLRDANLPSLSRA